MFNDELRQLRSLKDAPAPPEAVERGRLRLQAFMAGHPMMRPKPAFSWLGNAFVWKPALGLFMVGAVVSGAGGAVYASGASLPGERLYPVKLLSEEVQARLKITPEAKFRARALQAEHRLTEAQMIIDAETLPDEEHGQRDARLRVAMDRYQEHVDRLTAMAVKFDDDEDDTDEKRASKAFVAAKAVERMLERHENLVDSASTTDDEDAEEAVVVPMKRALELEARVSTALTLRGVLSDRVRQRAEKLRARWEKYEKTHDIKGNDPHDKEHGKEEVHDDGASHSHDHTEVEGPTVTPPLGEAPRPAIRVRIEGASDAKIETNVELETSNVR
jgi:hypothetical protein